MPKKPFVLALMPFKKQFKNVYDLGIKQAAVEAGARCERVDTQKFRQNILQQIYDQIHQADIIVAEMTGKNPNVFYETGYARALNKDIVLIVENEADITFDLKLYNHVIYEGDISKLKDELVGWIRYYIESPSPPGDGDGRLPLIKVSPSLIDRQVRPIPTEWCSRSLYLGLTGAQNWLSIVNNANYRANYFKDTVARLRADKALGRITIRTMVSLGPGNGATDRVLCNRLSKGERIEYVPVDINPFLLTTSVGGVGTHARTEFGVVCDFEDELVPFLRDALRVHSHGPYLFSMLGYTFGNLDSREGKFFTDMEELMSGGDYMLLDYIAVDAHWNYEEYSKTWHGEWDRHMRRLIGDAVAKRGGENGTQVAASFNKRFSFQRGASDVPGSYATFIQDDQTGQLVTNIRRYQKLGDWLRKTFGFEVVGEHTYIEADHAGTGYILIRKKQPSAAKKRSSAAAGPGRASARKGAPRRAA